MTREEAIEEIEYQIEMVEIQMHIIPSDSMMKVKIAFDLAIEALKQPEIVRCGECKHHEMNGGDCDALFFKYYDEDAKEERWFPLAYCSHAERRTE